MGKGLRLTAGIIWAALTAMPLSVKVSAQVRPTIDTIVVRADTIDIKKGKIAPKVDTVILRTDPSSSPRTAVDEGIFSRMDPLASMPESLVSAAQYAAWGDTLRLEYRFDEAVEAYAKALSKTDDPALRHEVERRMAMAQNGRNMTDYCSTPVVVARRQFSRKDFFLFYPLPSGSWRVTPNQLDSAASDTAPLPVYAPKGAKGVYFSAVDGEGARNLYLTRDLDSAWTAPKLLGESLLSEGNEIFPMLSPDGNTLYFASDGLYGMGGYDLYSCTRDRETGRWSAPVNMGFPYSSPADDFLLINSADGKYTIFASNRDCPPDSVFIYVLEYNPLPPRTPISDPVQLRRMAALVPDSDPSRLDNASAVSESIPSSDGTRDYMEKMAQVRSIRDSIYLTEKGLDELRLALGEAYGDEKAAIAEKIASGEQALIPLRKRLEKAGVEVQRIEKEFLEGGVVGQGDKGRKSEREVVGAASGYTFTKNSPGGKLKMKILPRPAAETIELRPVGRFASLDTFPSGLVYQIRFLISNRHATLDDIGGLAPVYERLTPDLKYICSAGLFSTYDNALSQLNKVRLAGFKDAAITAFRNGIAIPVDEARRLETAGNWADAGARP